MSLTFDQIKPGMRIRLDDGGYSNDITVSEIVNGMIFNEDGIPFVNKTYLTEGSVVVTSLDAPLITYNVGREDLQDILGPDADVDAWVEENGKHFTNRLDEMLCDLVQDLTDDSCDA